MVPMRAMTTSDKPEDNDYLRACNGLLRNLDDQAVILQHCAAFLIQTKRLVFLDWKIGSAYDIRILFFGALGIHFGQFHLGKVNCLNIFASTDPHQDTFCHSLTSRPRIFVGKIMCGGR